MIIRQRPPACPSRLFAFACAWPYSKRVLRSHCVLFLVRAAKKPGAASGGASSLKAEDIFGHTGLSGLEAAPVLPVPGMKPRIPTYIHTETGPATGHMLHDDDPRLKTQSKKGAIGSANPAEQTVSNPVAGADPAVSPPQAAPDKGGEDSSDLV